MQTITVIFANTWQRHQMNLAMKRIREVICSYPGITCNKCSDCPENNASRRINKLRIVAEPDGLQIFIGVASTENHLQARVKGLLDALIDQIDELTAYKISDS